MINKPRKAWIAGLLSFLLIGLGHIYSGNLKKGVLFYLWQAIIFTIFCWFFISCFSLIFLYIFIFIGFVFYIYAIVDAIKSAKKNSTFYPLKKYNKSYIYLLVFVFCNIIVQPSVDLFIITEIIEPVKVESSSMMPTLLLGDYILVKKHIGQNNHPQRSAIVAFTPPNDPLKTYVKRIIGVGGDIIEIKDKLLFVNNISQVERYTANNEPTVFPPNISPRDNFGPVTVPENKLFILGDNRDNSLDSRFWGFLSVDKVKGEAIGLYWSWDLVHQKIRWNRISKSIQQVSNTD